MIAAIPAEDRPTFIDIRTSADPLSAALNARGVKEGDWVGISMTFEGGRMSSFSLYDPPRTCLSCGAKTNTAGELPCGH